MGLTIKEIIPIGERILENSGVENFSIDAEALLGFEIGFDKKKIFMNWTHEVGDGHSERYFDLVNRRAAGEPLQYIMGEQVFMGHRFFVDPSVLIPRPETEALAEKAIAYLKTHESAKAVLDLCTGSGALAVSLAKACPGFKYTAADISAQALGVAKQNAAKLGVSGRIEFMQSDLFGALKRGAFGKKYGLIVTNPPYIRTGELAGLQREIAGHEPMLALDGGADGLDFYRRIAAGARPYLRPGGLVLAEIGCDQAAEATAIFAAAGFADTEVYRDLSGRDRIVKAV
ncbi:MAG: peptide chain release factor N(5)-glutamine methyltransferase [Clostridiales Family XIII bacterium]|jgi:release factor glutamine methyltransferase|nr:peptide chain release factor N(5)-glutamine methyltransferase [Clostridiales Family XIII bacterium]